MEASQSAGPSNSASTAPPTPDSTTNAQEFLSSGRTGRRNALPDILGKVPFCFNDYEFIMVIIIDVSI